MREKEVIVGFFSLRVAFLKDGNLFRGCRVDIDDIEPCFPIQRFIGKAFDTNDFAHDCAPDGLRALRALSPA